MPRQLELWATEPPPLPGGLLWKELDVEERAAVITLLARMLTKTVHPSPTPEKEEDTHER